MRMNNNFFKSLERHYYIFLSNSYLRVKHNFFFHWINFENIDLRKIDFSFSNRKNFSKYWN